MLPKPRCELAPKRMQPLSERDTTGTRERRGEILPSPSSCYSVSHVCLPLAKAKQKPVDKDGSLHGQHGTEQGRALRASGRMPRGEQGSGRRGERGWLSQIGC